MNEEVLVPGLTTAAPRPRRTMRIEAIDRHIGTRIRMARVSRGMTMGTLAEAIGVSVPQVEKYERADNTVAPARLHAIARALNVAPGWFFDEFPPDQGLPFEGSIEVAEHLQGEVIGLAEQIASLPAAQRTLVRAMVKQLRAAANDTAGDVSVLGAAE